MPKRKISPMALFRRMSQLVFGALLVYGLWSASDAANSILPPDLLLQLDPLVGLSAAIASRVFVATLVFTAVTLTASALLGRVFCGWCCPLGALIDLFDFAIVKRIVTAIIKRSGQWLSPGQLSWCRYLVLSCVVGAAVFGLLLTPFVSPLPMLNRAMALVWFRAAPVTETGLPASSAVWVAASMVAAAVLLGLFATRFWCRVLCPSGALLGLVGRFGLRRRVSDACISCGKCAQGCPTGAIDPADFSSRSSQCIVCLKCRDVCPVDAVSFGWKGAVGSATADPSRRGVISAIGSGAAGLVLGAVLPLRAYAREKFLRPPGAQKEDDFLTKCVGCGECIRACPTNALQLVRKEGGIEQRWTPRFDMTVGGCVHECNNCGQVCPTGAIPALPLVRKQDEIIGIARVKQGLCLPWHNDIPCNYCEAVCPRNAIIMRYTTPGGRSLTYGAPEVLPLRCNGCGMCEFECYKHNVLLDGFMDEPAIRVFHPTEAFGKGPGRKGDERRQRRQGRGQRN